MSGFEKFKERLPSNKTVYSLLTVQEIGDKKCEHVLKVWDRFEMKTIKDYHDLHLKYYVLFLASVFEKLRNSSLKKYGLCPNYYLNAPAFSGMQCLV